MTKSVAVMCQEKGYKIRCNSVHPGAIETPMVQLAEGRPGAAPAIPEGVLPHGAKGAPRDVAHMVLFLASDESRYLTGAEFVVDNGLTVRPWSASSFDDSRCLTLRSDAPLYVQRCAPTGTFACAAL